MNNDPIPASEPVATTSGEGVAEHYVRDQLAKAKAGLLRTQIISSLVVLGLGGYTLYVTNRFRQNLEPREAATITKGLVAQRLEEQGPVFADYVKREVPALIKQAPDYALKELPNVRAEVETRVSTEIERYAKETSEQLGGEVDKFLENNKESVQALIKDGQDPAAMAKVTSELRGVFDRYLDEPMPAVAGGTSSESMKAKIDQALEVLKKVEARMKRLATAKDLTPAEANAKRAIGVLMKTVTNKRMEAGQTEGVTPEAIQRAGEQIRAGAENAANAAREGANRAANIAGGGSR